jgi:hypothetical protein
MRRYQAIRGVDAIRIVAHVIERSSAETRLTAVGLAFANLVGQLCSAFEHALACQSRVADFSGANPSGGRMRSRMICASVKHCSRN